MRKAAGVTGGLIVIASVALRERPHPLPVALPNRSAPARLEHLNET
jgi:hypothetical protein